MTATPTITRTAIPTETPIASITPTPFPCDETSGQVITINDNFSEVARENLRYQVYLPPCYQQTTKRFPYTILIHGLSYRETQWEDLGLSQILDQGIRLGVLPPMIVVMPYMGRIGTNNSFPPDASYETFILEELMPTIERNFCTWNDRDYRAIGGISRGGFWAFSVAMRHPDLFGKVGGHSAFFPNNTNEIPPAFNPIELAVNSSFLEEVDLEMHLDNGAGDSAGLSQQTFSSQLTSKGIPHLYVIHPVGEHNNEYWSAHISEYLTFYGDGWSRSYDELPSCLEASP
jgi:enterochelin esterase-like enzyme